MTSNSYIELKSTFSPQEQKVAPDQLYFEGDFDLLKIGTRVAVVGSRKVSPEGIERARSITRILVNHGITVVSGLAKGVDTTAHVAAIENGGKTIAVLGTPIDKCYPAENKGLLQEIKNNHLAISQFPIGQRTYRGDFPKRNKTMALISDATIIIEASENSGTRHQAIEAIRMGRELFFLESLINTPGLKWPHELLKYGATILTKENVNQEFEKLSEFAIF